MKNLKFLIVGILLLGLNSCADDDKILSIPPSGALITITPDAESTAVFDLNNASNSIFSAEFLDATNNVANYELNANVYYAGTATRSSSVVVFSASEFPSRLEISAAQVLSQLGIPQTGVVPGDLIEFRAVLTTDDGRVFDSTMLNGDARGEALIGAYSWDLAFGCDWQGSAVNGTTWSVSYSYYWGDPTDVYAESVGTTTATESNGVVTFSDIWGPGLDLVVTVNTASGGITSAESVVLQSTFGPYADQYYTARSLSGKNFFSCATTDLSFALKTCVDAGCYSSGSDATITLTKN